MKGLRPLLDARVVDQHVELRKLRDDAGGERDATGLVGDVGLDRVQAVARGDLELAATSAADDHVGARAAQARREREADARGTAGDEDGAVGDVDGGGGVHGWLLR
jgi:hypothetical protein